MNASQKPAATADREAAEWFARLGSTSVPTETIHAFFAWRAKPENAAAYKRIEGHWERMGRLRGDPEIEAMMAGIGKPGAGRASVRAPFGRPVFGAVLAVLVAGAGIGVWWALTRPPVYATAVGEQRTVQLADGSAIRLDTDSRVRVRLSDGARRIDMLQGQALFEVAHDAARPFVVSADATTVTALGTVFDVRRTGDDVRVVLVQGRVRVDDPRGGQTVLAPSQAATVTPRGAQARPVDAAVATSWAEGRLIFSGAPLGEAVAEVNRYLTDKVILDAPGVAGTPISGAFRVGDRGAFVSAASEVFALKAQPQPGGAVKLVPRRTKNS